MVSFADLRDADPRRWEPIADTWDRLADTVADHAQQVRAQTGALADAWQGDAADAAGSAVGDLATRLDGHESSMRDIASTVRNASGDFAGAHADLASAIDTAGQWGIDVGEDGSVSVDPGKLAGDLADPAKLAELPGAIGSVAGAIGDAVTRAGTADDRATKALATHGSTPPVRAAGAMKPQMRIGDPGSGTTTPPDTSDPKAAADEAARLAVEMPWMNEADLARLKSLLDAFKNNPAFATEFLTQVGQWKDANGDAEGASGLLDLLGQLDRMNAGTTESAARQADLPGIQSDLGYLLGTATDPNNQPNMGDMWIADLNSACAGTVDIGMSTLRPYGFQLLAPILANGSYSTGFLNTIGDTMLQFENGDAAIWATETPPAGFSFDQSGSGSSGVDPLAGLMQGLANNPAAGQEFFDPTTPSGMQQLTYLLSQRPWISDLRPPVKGPFDGAPTAEGYLGQALQNASTGTVHSQLQASIAAATVHILATSSHGTVPTVLQHPVGEMLAAYIDDVNAAGTMPTPTVLAEKGADGESSAVFDQGEVDSVLKQAAQDPNAYVDLYNAERAYSAYQLNAAAADPSAANTQDPLGTRQTNVEAAASASSLVFAQLDAGKAMATAKNNAATDAAYNQAIQERGNIANFVVGKLTSKIPLAGKGIEAYITMIEASAQKDSSATTTDQINALYDNGGNQITQLVSNAMWNNSVWPTDEKPPADLLDKNGKPLDMATFTPQQQTDYYNWTRGRDPQGNPNYGYSTTSEAVQASRDEYENDARISMPPTNTGQSDKGKS